MAEASRFSRRDFLRAGLMGGAGATLAWPGLSGMAFAADGGQGVCMAVCNHWTYVDIGFQLGIESCVLSVSDAMEMADLTPAFCPPPAASSPWRRPACNFRRCERRPAGGSRSVWLKSTAGGRRQVWKWVFPLPARARRISSARNWPKFPGSKAGSTLPLILGRFERTR